jgi:hypothetical protein
MTRLLLIFIAFSCFSPATLADLVSPGARYVGQGGATVANSNDTFALSVNPANLLSHSSNNIVEVAVNMGMDRGNEFIQEAQDLNYVGGFFASNMFALGAFYNNNIALTPTGNSPVANKPDPIDILHTGYAAAIGNTLEQDDNLSYGLGYVYDLFTVTNESSRRKQDGAGYTLSAKLAYQFMVPLQSQALSLYIAAGLSYSDEILPVKDEKVAISLRPEIMRGGVTLEFAHLNEDFTWTLGLSAEGIEASASQPLISTDYPLGTGIKLGAEWSLIQPFGLDGDFAIRVGRARYDANVLNSGGLGLTYGMWSFDFAVAEHNPLEPSIVYSFSVTKSFARGQ